MHDTSANSDRRLVIDATFLLRRHLVRPTGIDRVQLEVVDELLRRADPRVTLVEFDEALGVYRDLPTALARERVDRMRGLAERQQVQPASRRTNPGLRGRVKRIVGQVFGWSPAAQRQVMIAGGHARRALVAIRAAGTEMAKSLRGRRSGVTTPCASLGWDANTTFASLEFRFDPCARSVLAARSTDRSATITLMVHDLIPIVRPQYATIEFFDDFIVESLAIADVVLVNSQWTERDLVQFAHERGLIQPAIAMLPIGSALADLEAARPLGLDAADQLARSGFVLYVSTLTLRKNHHLLLDVWEQYLADRDPADVPPLVIAGQRGSLSTEVQSRIDRTPEFKGVVFHLGDAVDGEIAWLYQHCRFTVYPSHYEGWGLPVSESHDFGKVCLAADRTSLPEAGEGLAVLLDPFDRSAWSAEVLRWWNDDGMRRTLEQKIAVEHHRVMPAETLDALLRVAGLS